MNKIRWIAAGVVLSVVFMWQRAAAQRGAVFLSDSEIREILIDRVDTYRQTVGIVVGLIGPEGRRVVAYGRLASDDPRSVDGDTIFEIGSITKVFTSLLLADMKQRGEVQLTDPVAQYLPPEVRMPERNGEQITLVDLAMHTSGLPRMPTNVDASDPFNPYAEYSVDRLYQFLSGYRLTRNIGSRFEYSNLGGALLGHALEKRAGASYASLLEQRITAPLGMNSTGVVLTAEMKTRLARGHAYALEPIPNWDMGALAGAGALHSTANDLLTFLAANLGYTDTPLAPAMAAMLKTRRDTGRGQVNLAWFVDVRDGVETVFHSGSTGGYLSFIGYDPGRKVGVVVLSNSGIGAGVDDIGVHLLNADAPLLSSKALTPPKQRKEVLVDSTVLERYAGRYRFPSGQMATVTRQGNILFLQGDGEVKVAFFPESRESFFAKLMDAQITFRTDALDHVKEFLFHRSDVDLQVQRID